MTSLPQVEADVERVRRALRDLWLRVSPTDRIFAIDRLLREEVIAPEREVELERHADRVRDAWVLVRVRRHTAPGAADTLRASLALELAERDRDAYLDAHDLFDALFGTAEGYLRTVPNEPGERSFKELLRMRAHLRAQLVRILPPLDETRAA